jgi:CBS domain-containing protein
MLKARDIMNNNPAYCGLDTPLSEIAQRFADESISGLLVVNDDKRLLGVITESDLIDQQARLHVPTAIAIFDMVIPLGEGRFERELERMQALSAGDLMSGGPATTVTIDAGLNDIAALMHEGDVHCLPVVDGDNIEGVITQHDVIRALARRQPH